MIQVEWYYRDELDEHSEPRRNQDGSPEYRTYDARVIGHENITGSASNHAGGQEAMRAHLVQAWNRAFPDDPPKNVDDFEFVYTENRW
jgi:hypothetical protein